MLEYMNQQWLQVFGSCEASNQILYTDISIFLEIEAIAFLIFPKGPEPPGWL